MVGVALQPAGPPHATDWKLTQLTHTSAGLPPGRGPDVALPAPRPQREPTRQDAREIDAVLPRGGPAACRAVITPCSGVKTTA